MKTIPAALQTHFDGGVVNMGTLWRVQRTDNVVVGFTDHIEDVPFDDGNGLVTYLSTIPYDRTAVSSTIDFSVDNLDIESVFDTLGVTKDDLEAGVWDHAAAKLYLFNYEKLSDGQVKLRVGVLGEFQFGDSFKIEFRGLLQKYAVEVVDIVQALCGVKFGSNPGCYMVTDAPSWSASLPTAERIINDAKDGIVVAPTSENDRWFEATNVGLTGPSEPSWDTTIGNTTTEVLTTAIWITLTSYPAGSQVLENGLIWVSDGGTSDVGEPAWTGTPGDTIADADIIWTAFATVATIWVAVQSRRVSAAVDVVTTNADFTVTYTGDLPDAQGKAGFVIVTSGPNAGFERGIKLWTLSSNTIVLFQAFPFLLSSLDTLIIVAGCDKTAPTCQNEYDNKINFRGQDRLPGRDLLLTFPDAQPG